MEEITVILGFRWFQDFWLINWLAACKTEHLGTSLALFADDSPQVLDIHIEGGLVAGKCSSVATMERLLTNIAKKWLLALGNEYPHEEGHGHCPSTS